MSVRSTSDLRAPPIHPVVRVLSLLWLLPKRAYLRRFRLGREVRERVAGVELIVLPDVFNPVVFRTGKYFAEILQYAELPRSTSMDAPPRALDLGTGSGILAIVAAKRGFEVDAVDLNPAAVRCARVNVANDESASAVTVYHGDLFEPVAGSRYDLVTFHPPSFRGDPASKFEMCWRSIDVFERFAEGLPKALNPGGMALVLQTSHGDEVGLLDALVATGLRVDIHTRRHFGAEILSIYEIRHATD